MHRAARLEKTSPISDGFRRHPQTLSSPPPQSQVFSGTKESAGCIGPVHWPAAAECLTCYVRGRTLSRPLSASVCGKYDMPSRRPYERIAEGLISACRKHVVVATRLSPFKVGDNQRLERTMSGAAKTSAYFPLHDQPPTGTKESELSPLSRTLYEVGGLIFRHPPSGATRIVDTKAEGFPPGWRIVSKSIPILRHTPSYAMVFYLFG